MSCPQSHAQSCSQDNQIKKAITAVSNSLYSLNKITKTKFLKFVVNLKKRRNSNSIGFQSHLRRRAVVYTSLACFLGKTVEKRLAVVAALSSRDRSWKPLDSSWVAMAVWPAKPSPRISDVTTTSADTWTSATLHERPCPTETTVSSVLSAS